MEMKNISPSLVRDLKGRIGVYGFAKSYISNGIQDDSVPPYFFRGEIGDLASANGNLNTLTQSKVLSEEMELVWLIDTEKGTTCRFIGFMFGNDLTDLGEFRQDAARILHAKLPQASISDHWWPSLQPPSSLNITVTRYRGDNVKHYFAKVGMDYLPISLDTALNAVYKMVGWKHFDKILLFTGAPRGFAWKNEPALDNDRFELIVDELGSILNNRIYCYD
ncbi:hypothetical protein [Xenorhabdus anantnagensis]|uniref:Uncharacterized protein n=1 Tax=Xenorhabdus anantnagensis TaxID=3025875 RepID=A0ABT5LWW2_9GAMM|nr:hypothetical protein [Xenorhabdus anantnagensis]MDC9598795.1 hypothetical protein [Xenorhabdus anantnagensis]